jgi:predicted patatin/cPLA2 family phospholipase
MKTSPLSQVASSIVSALPRTHVHKDAGVASAAPATGEGVALVLEGGGMRGMFTAGVIDVLLREGLGHAFSHVWGVSAGAINGANFMAGHDGRFCRDVLAFRDNPEFMSVRSLVTTGDMVGRDFLYNRINNEFDPFDYAAFNANPIPFTVVATDVMYGSAAYLEVASLPQDMNAIVASASLPLVSEFVEYQGRNYLDGGPSCSIPVEAALAHGDANRALVVLTRERSYVKTSPSVPMGLARRRYKEQPLLIEALQTRPERYNAQRAAAFELEQAGSAVVIAPPTPVNLPTLPSSGTPLLELYVQGRAACEAELGNIKALLGSTGGN